MASHDDDQAQKEQTVVTHAWADSVQLASEHGLAQTAESAKHEYIQEDAGASAVLKLLRAVFAFDVSALSGTHVMIHILVNS